MILWSSLGCCDKTWQLYLQFIFISVGVFGSRLWTALLALALYFLRTRSLCFVLKLRPWFVGIGWGIPAVIATVLLSTVDTETDHAQKSDPNFQYGQTQAIVAVVILISSFLGKIFSIYFYRIFFISHRICFVFSYRDLPHHAATIWEEIQWIPVAPYRWRIGSRQWSYANTIYSVCIRHWRLWKYFTKKW